MICSYLFSKSSHGVLAELDTILSGNRLGFLWFFDSLILWFFDSLILWFFDSLNLWFFDSLILWFFDSLILWFFDSYEKSKFLGSGGSKRQMERRKRSDFNGVSAPDGGFGLTTWFDTSTDNSLIFQNWSFGILRCSKSISRCWGLSLVSMICSYLFSKSSRGIVAELHTILAGNRLGSSWVP